MLAATDRGPVAIALATIDELSPSTRRSPDAEQVASRIAAYRAIQRIAGDHGTIDIRRRVNRAPVAHYRSADSSRRRVALSLSHCNGHAAAMAAPAGSRIGIDLELLEAIDSSRERFFLTERERCSTPAAGAALLWPIKEAVWKALQLGTGIGFHELELEIERAGEIRAVRFREMRWHADIAITFPWPGYILATAQLRSRQ